MFTDIQAASRRGSAAASTFRTLRPNSCASGATERNKIGLSYTKVPPPPPPRAWPLAAAAAIKPASQPASQPASSGAPERSKR